MKTDLEELITVEGRTLTRAEYIIYLTVTTFMSADEAWKLACRFKAVEKRSDVR